MAFIETSASEENRSDPVRQPEQEQADDQADEDDSNISRSSEDNGKSSQDEGGCDDEEKPTSFLGALACCTSELKNPPSARCSRLNRYRHRYVSTGDGRGI